MGAELAHVCWGGGPVWCSPVHFRAKAISARRRIRRPSALGRGEVVEEEGVAGSSLQPDPRHSSPPWRAVAVLAGSVESEGKTTNRRRTTSNRSGV
uniref:Uncharacterized protein n=1 Tax=Setaria viridis TaxID=4556 RepID=A0A4U6TM28_SETVI|nr:hypothetical protein SEVIR_7G059201v2 [Setaria viridis]